VNRLLSIAFLSMSAMGLARAQDVVTPPAPAAPRPLAITAPADFTLPNGLRVIVAERHGLPLVTAGLLVRSGSEADPSGKAGVASLTAQLLTKGTRKHDATAIANAAEALGGTLRAQGGWDASTVSITITKPKLDAALALIDEVATEPTFTGEELEGARKRQIDALGIAYANPGNLASLVATKAIFGDAPYGHPAEGTPASLAKIVRDDVVAFHRARFRPDNAVLILVGDVTAAQARTLAARHFGGWVVPAAALATTSTSNASASKTVLTIVDMGASGQAGVVVAFPLPKGDTAQQATAELTNSILGGGFSSRLNQEIRIKRGLSYGARAVVDERRDGGVVRATVQTKNESAAEVVTLIGAELDKLANEPVPADELAARKATLIGTFSRSVETTSGLATLIAGLVAKDRSPAELADRIQRYSAVDAAAAQAYAKSTYATANRRTAIGGDAKQFEATLKTSVPDLVSVRQADLDLDR
jgi:zinc protease